MTDPVLERGRSPLGASGLGAGVTGHGACGDIGSSPGRPSVNAGTLFGSSWAAIWPKPDPSRRLLLVPGELGRCVSDACHQHADTGLGRLLLAVGEGQFRGPDVPRVCQGAPGKPHSRPWCSMLKHGFILGNWLVWLSLAGASQLCRAGHRAEDPGESRRCDSSLKVVCSQHSPFREWSVFCAVRSFN